MEDKELQNLIESIDGFQAVWLEKPPTINEVIKAEYINYELIARRQNNPWIASAFLEDKLIGFSAHGKTQEEALLRLKDLVEKTKMLN